MGGVLLLIAADGSSQEAIAGPGKDIGDASGRPAAPA